LTTKIHGVVAAPGNPLHLFLSAGNEHDVKFAPQLLCTLTVEGAAVNADRGYDSQALVDWLKSRSAIPNIPSRQTNKDTARMRLVGVQRAALGRVLLAKNQAIPLRRHLL
jgi:IS5 family transposase